MSVLHTMSAIGIQPSHHQTIHSATVYLLGVLEITDVKIFGLFERGNFDTL